MNEKQEGESHMFICKSDERDRMKSGNLFFQAWREQNEIVRKKHNLKKVEAQILGYLYIANPGETRGTDICKYLQMNKAMVSKTLDALEKRGLVEYQADENDRRFVHYYLADAAKPLCDDWNAIWSHAKSELFHGIPAEQVNIFLQVSRKMYENLIALSFDNQNQEKGKEM